LIVKSQASKPEEDRSDWATLLGLLAPATLIMAVDRAVLAVTGPSLQSKFDLTLTELGGLFTAFFWAYAAMQVPAGLIVQRYGARLAMLWAIVIWSVMTIATPYAASFAILLILRIFLGMGQAADWPASIVAIGQKFSARSQPTANAVLLCALYVGPVIGAPLTGYFLDVWGLESIFIVAGGVGILFAAVWALLYRDNNGSEQKRIPGLPTASPPGGHCLRRLMRDRSSCWVPMLEPVLCSHSS
jgi:MFS transporter, ACS family, glucarate transporter